MDLWTPWIAAYGLIALIAIAMTRREQRSHGQITPLNEVLGLSLSALWPLAVCLILGALMWRVAYADNGRKELC